MPPTRSAVDLAALDLGLLALFVGQKMNEMVRRRLAAAGFPELRDSHGYLFQHLVDGDRSITELARRMGVTQQAVSKTIAELARAGYVEDAPSDDARARRVRLSTRGRAALTRARALRRTVEARLLAGRPAAEIAHARAFLTAALERLGGAPAVRARRVREPPR